jgi:hypothetical protein
MYRSILDREIENWENFASNLRDIDKELFNQMLKSAYKYSSAIEAKGEDYATQSLLMSLLLEQHKKVINHKQNYIKY